MEITDLSEICAKMMASNQDKQNLADGTKISIVGISSGGIYSDSTRSWG